jgi:formylglycine-generating enzyme
MMPKNKHIYFYIVLMGIFVCQYNFAQSLPNFVLVPKGEYVLGKKGHLLNPFRVIQLDSFYISTTEITNAQFQEFVKATKFKTDAEKKHNAMVFEPGLKEFKWLQDSTAYWRYPNGTTRGDIKDKMNHPVTCISYRDAEAYCKWAGVRLPTLNEWEAASRATATTDFAWGNQKDSLMQYANVWHGKDHLKGDDTDGYMYTSPVASFKPNNWGLYDMYGNVFEFCSGQLKNDKAGVVHARGGSWWCSKNSCSFFNSVDIGRVSAYASFSNQGFRVVQLKQKDTAMIK